MRAIILGLETNGLAVVRALAQHKVPVVIIEEETKKDQAHLKTKYGEKVILERTIGRPLLDFFQSLQCPAVLFPTTDRQVGWLSDNRHLLPADVRLMFPDKIVVDTLADKSLFFDFCIRNDLSIPPYVYVASEQDIFEKCSSLRFPLIIKTPKKVYKKGLHKAYVVYGNDELSLLWNKIRNLHTQFIVQEFVQGEDSDVYFCLQYISSDGVLLASFTGRKIRQWKPLCGGTASCEPVSLPSLHIDTYSIFRQAGFWGIGSMEYKLDRTEDKYYVVEPTVCRTDFQEQLAIANGVNIPWIAYQDVLGNSVLPVIADGGDKAWMHVMHDRLAAEYYIKNKKITQRQWISSLAKVRSFDLFSVKDPVPALVSLFKRFS